MTDISRLFTALLGFLVAASISFRSYGQSDRFNVDSINSLVSKLSSDTERVKTLIEMASVIYCEDSGSKLIIANEAKHLAEKKQWRWGMIRSNTTLGVVYFYCLKNYPKAFEYFQENVTQAKKNNDTIAEADALEKIAKFYGILNQYDKSIEYYDQVIALKLGPDRAISVLGDMGVAYNSIADYANALACYSTAIGIFDSLSRAKKTNDIEDTIVMAGLLLNLGDIYLEMQLPDKAFEKYNNALKIGIGGIDKNIEILSLTGVGKSYKIKKNYPLAIEYYQKALEECNKSNDFKNEVKILDELANTFMETWVLDKALEYAENSLRLAEVQSYLDLLSRSYITLGNVYLKKNDYEVAVSYLQKALSISQQTKQLEDQRDAWNSLSSAYEHNGQSKDAFDAYRHYVTIRDSVFNISKSNELTRKDVEWNMRRIKQADSLAQAIVFGKKIERQQVITYSGFAGLVLVLLLAFFIYRNYNTQRKYNELLSKEKTRHLAHIEAQSNVLSDIAHIQAHQVRGPVATILGLIQIFNYDDPSDPINKEVMEGLSVVTERLDTVVKEVIYKENKLRSDKSREDNDVSI